MLTDELDLAGGKMKGTMIRLTAVLALFATTACTAERALSPAAPATTGAVGSMQLPQLPLLYVVDGVRMQRDELPNLSNDQIAQVTVMKGSAALKAYGPDASYGVVVVTTKVAAPRS
jgi:hypothetical protein